MKTLASTELRPTQDCYSRTFKTQIITKCSDFKRLIAASAQPMKLDSKITVFYVQADSLPNGTEHDGVLTTMSPCRRLHRYVAWLALCVMCFGAIAPAMSKWLATTQGVLWVEICGDAPAQRLSLSANLTENSSQTPAVCGDCCPYCTLIHYLPFVPSANRSFVSHRTVFEVAFIVVASSVLATHTWRHAHLARAPPAR